MELKAGEEAKEEQQQEKEIEVEEGEHDILVDTTECRRMKRNMNMMKSRIQKWKEKDCKKKRK